MNVEFICWQRQRLNMFIFPTCCFSLSVKLVTIPTWNKVKESRWARWTEEDLSSWFALRVSRVYFQQLLVEAEQSSAVLPSINSYSLTPHETVTPSRPHRESQHVDKPAAHTADLLSFISLRVFQSLPNIFIYSFWWWTAAPVLLFGTTALNHIKIPAVNFSPKWN